MTTDNPTGVLAVALFDSVASTLAREDAEPRRAVEALVSVAVTLAELAEMSADEVREIVTIAFSERH